MEKELPDHQQMEDAYSASLLAPRFWRLLSDPERKKVLLVGCGGGFDFVHSLLLYPELMRMGKEVIIVSNSFGRVEDFHALPVYPVTTHPSLYPDVRLVSASTGHNNPAFYAPEKHVLSFLDEKFPQDAPHTLYACYARDNTVPRFARFLNEIDADAIVAVDGGSDSLMLGDEEGLGDPIEDAITVASVQACSAPVKVLLTVGLGSDRFNHVSDASSLRAIAELTRVGGFMGCTSIQGPPFDFYRSALDHIYEKQSFRSVLAGCISAAGVGYYGADKDSARAVGGRVKAGECFVWPLMALIWAFDVTAVARRSLIVSWVRNVTEAPLLIGALDQGRKLLSIREGEELPRHTDFRSE